VALRVKFGHGVLEKGCVVGEKVILVFLVHDRTW
jgi:hypothetical protein